MKQRLLNLALAVSAGLLLTAPASQAATNYVSGFLTGTNTWYATNTYVMTNFTYVLSNAVLNIEAGTVVRGRNGSYSSVDANGVPGGFGALIINRGAKIFAEGTAANPIIFTAENDIIEDPFDMPISGTGSRGLWGGIVINGSAVLNSSVRLALSPVQDTYEGLADAFGPGGEPLFRFGGTDDNDNSGVVRYVSIRHGGKTIDANKEINGLSMGAVGRGTTIEHVESYLIADDGFEFFGGTVNTKYLVSAFCDDDTFDADQGWSGKNQFWFSIQEPGARDEGGELNGVPNELDALGTYPFPGSFEVYNWTSVGAGTGAGSGNEALVIRQYNNCKIQNSVFTEFDGRKLVLGTNSAPEVKYNLFNECIVGNGNLGSTAGTPLALNPEANPLLRGINRTNINQLDPRPLPGSPVFTDATTPPNDGFFTQVSFKGAFDSCENWMRGWTALDQNLFLGTLHRQPTNTVMVSGYLTGTNTWHATNVYLMTNFVYCLSNSVLTIEPGTLVRGRNGTYSSVDANGVPGGFGCLVINRGAKLFAEGTECDPIIFTSEFDNINDPLDMPISGTGSRGLWGGIVINGSAVLNSSVRLALSPVQDTYEGLADAFGPGGEPLFRFGGTDDNDNSGVVRYVSIRHGGKTIDANKEINGLSMGAVGRGTTIEHVEAYLIADDGFEFFGGTVNTKYLVSAFCDDDTFDADQGWSGKNQFWFSIQEPGARDEGGELNGVPNELDALGTYPFPGSFEVYNWTSVGAGVGAGSGNEALVIRQYNNCKIQNSVFTEFDGRKLVLGTNSAPEVKYNLFNECIVGNGNLGSTAGTPLALNPEANPLLWNISRENLGTLNPLPQSSSPVFTDATTPPNDGFYITTATNKGAFATSNWMLKWTALDNNAFLSWRYHTASVTALVPMAPTLTITAAGGGSVQITHPSQTGFSYQLKSTTTLSPAAWGNEGGAQPGTGGMLTNTVSAVGNKFFQVLVQ